VLVPSRGGPAPGANGGTDSVFSNLDRLGLTSVNRGPCVTVNRGPYEIVDRPNLNRTGPFSNHQVESNCRLCKSDQIHYCGQCKYSSEIAAYIAMNKDHDWYGYKCAQLRAGFWFLFFWKAIVVYVLGSRIFYSSTILDILIIVLIEYIPVNIFQFRCLPFQIWKLDFIPQKLKFWILIQNYYYPHKN
jgi:hypothetical protein